MVCYKGKWWTKIISFCQEWCGYKQYTVLFLWLRICLTDSHFLYTEHYVGQRTCLDLSDDSSKASWCWYITVIITGLSSLSRLLKRTQCLLIEVSSVWWTRVSRYSSTFHLRMETSCFWNMFFSEYQRMGKVQKSVIVTSEDTPGK